jgi:hypothetical protein
MSAGHITEHCSHVGVRLIIENRRPRGRAHDLTSVLTQPDDARSLENFPQHSPTPPEALGTANPTPGPVCANRVQCFACNDARCCLLDKRRFGRHHNQATSPVPERPRPAARRQPAIRKLPFLKRNALRDEIRVRGVEDDLNPSVDAACRRYGIEWSAEYALHRRTTD